MRFAQEISIFNPYAIEKQIIALGTSITQTAREIELRADSMYAEKGAVTEMQSRLTIMADSISSEVTARQDADSAMSSRIYQTAQAISSEVTARQNADSTLSSKIDQTPHTIKLSISNTKASKTTGPSITLTVKDANGNTLSTDSGTIKIDGNVVFTNDLSTAGSTTINGGNITTGTMSAARIKGGTLSLGGANNVNGQMRIYDASNNEIGRWNKDGIYIRDGEIYQEQYVDSTVKNAWLRIKSTNITGGYTGLNHTAKLDLSDYTDVVEGSATRKVGVMSLRCENGGIAMVTDDITIANSKKGLSMLSREQGIFGYIDRYPGDSDGTARHAWVLSKPGMVSINTMNSSGEFQSEVAVNENRSIYLYADEIRTRKVGAQYYYTGTTQMNCNFAPDSDGLRRRVDIINGLICNLRYW